LIIYKELSRLNRKIKRLGMKRIIDIFLMIMFTFFLSTIFSAPLMGAEIKKEKKDNVPIHITSDNMISNNKEKVIIFKGNVVVKKGDITIYSDTLNVYHSEEGNKKTSNIGSGNISKVIAIGNVKIDQGDRHAEGQRAEYFNKEQKVVLTGDPVVWEKGNKVSGTEMIFYLEEDKSIIKGSKERRVNVSIFPEEKQSEPIGKTGKKKNKAEKNVPSTQRN